MCMNLCRFWTYAYMWRPEVNVKCLSVSFSVLDKTLTECTVSLATRKPLMSVLALGFGSLV